MLPSLLLALSLAPGGGRAPVPRASGVSSVAPPAQRTAGGSEGCEGSALASADPEVFGLIEAEAQRQRDGLELIASENFVSAEVCPRCSRALRPPELVTRWQRRLRHCRPRACSAGHGVTGASSAETDVAQTPPCLPPLPPPPCRCARHLPPHCPAPDHPPASPHPYRHSGARGLRLTPPSHPLTLPPLPVSRCGRRSAPSSQTSTRRVFPAHVITAATSTSTSWKGCARCGSPNLESRPFRPRIEPDQK